MPDFAIMRQKAGIAIHYAIYGTLSRIGWGVLRVRDRMHARWYRRVDG
jgi:hypothetical protein